MERLIKYKNQILISLFLFTILVLVGVYQITAKKSKNEKYFDIILASLYNNEEISSIDNKLSFLSNLDDPNISFFSDLKLASIDNLDKYKKIDKDLIILKKALVDLDPQNLKNLSMDENFIFKDIIKIYYLNSDLNYLQIYEQDNSEITDNFFLNAVKRYSNEIN